MVKTVYLWRMHSGGDRGYQYGDTVQWLRLELATVEGVSLQVAVTSVIASYFRSAA